MIESVMQGDCLVLLPTLSDKSVDMVLCDLPYGMTSNLWDSVINLPALWVQYNRVCRGRVVLTAAQPFTSVLIMSNVTNFKHSWTWIKNRPTGFQNAKKMPLRATEDIIIFNSGVYNPQGLARIDRVCKNSKSCGGSNTRGDVLESVGKGNLRTPGSSYVQEFTGYPRNVLEIPYDALKVHPTQKPVALFEYLIRTYTNEGDVVLDTCCGSGTTGVAAQNTGRRFIQMEMDDKYCEIARSRLRAVGVGG